jgi:hypothetical protein
MAIIRAQLIVGVIVVVAAGMLSAQSLQSWKDASGNKGPSSIVYSDLRSEAESSHRDQENTCSKEFSCISDRFRGNAVVEAHKTLRDQLKEIESGKSAGKLTDAQYQDAVNRIEDNLAKRDGERIALLDEAKTREGRAAECATARRKTILAYQKYVDRLQTAERDSANKDSVEFIRKLQGTTKESVEAHVGPHDRVTKDAANCRSAADSLNSLKKLKKGDLL